MVGGRWKEMRIVKKIILFVILDQYADWEAAYLSSAIYMLGQGKYEVRTVALTKECVRSIGGFRTMPDHDIHSMPEEYEALILIGGMSWRSEEAKQVKTIVEECVNKGKVLGGICDASGFLGTIGMLNEVKHTGNDLGDIKSWAKDAYTGAEKYVMQQAVSDKNVITANGTAALEFAREVMLTLQVASEDAIIEWYNFHKLGYYEAPMPKM